MNKKLIIIISIVAIIILLSVAFFVKGGKEVTDSVDQDISQDIPEDVNTDTLDLSDDSEDAENLLEIAFDNGFSHTAPGEYSEINVVAMGLPPGEKVIVYVNKVDSDEEGPSGQELIPDEYGVINTNFMITSYGDWEVELHSGGAVYTDVVTVE